MVDMLPSLKGGQVTALTKLSLSSNICLYGKTIGENW